MILLLVAAAWLAGASMGALGLTSWWPAVVLGGAGVVLVLASSGRRHAALLAIVMLLAGAVSLARYEAAMPSSEPGGVAVFNDGDAVHLLGTVVSEPEEGETSQRFVVEVAAVEVDGAWVENGGRVLVTARSFPQRQYGETVELRAELETPPAFEGFDYREYLARRGIVSTTVFPSVTVLSDGGGNGLQRLIIETRKPLGDALARSLPEPEAALARGILLGQRASIPDDVNEAFNAAGISHLIAISGYNVMLVAGAMIGALTPMAGRRRATVVAMAVVVAYAVFVGGSPSVLRAMVMGEVMLGATLAGRPGSALTGVALAGAVLVLWRPLIVDDASFQLSFAATLGIVTLATPLRERLLGLFYGRVPNAVASALADSLAVTTAATVAVLPIIASAFGRLSIVSLPANLIAGPIFVFALLGSFVTAVAGAIDADAGRLVGEVAYLPLHWLVALAEGAASLPGASAAIGGFGVLGATTVYGLLGAIAWLLRQDKREVVAPGSLPRVGAVPVLAMASVVVSGWLWWGALQPSEDHLRVSVLDVGQGDAILIEAPSGARVLVDGGPSGSRLMQALGDALPASERRIDLVVLTHAQEDHVTGLIDLMERYEVGGVVWNGLSGTSAAAWEWEHAVERRGLPVAIAEAGQVIELGDGARIEVVHPQPRLLEGTEDDLNNNAVVLRLVYGAVSFLLTGDIEVDGENAILEAGEDVSATVLKVSHHGSDGATTPAFLEAVSPSLAVVSVGGDNNFGHPSPSLRLRLAGVPLLRTDLNGTVRFETDGQQLWLVYERGEIEAGEALGVR